MTPRQADVAYVLEGVPGVTAVYAITPGSRTARHFDFSIEVESDQKQQALAHYMLLRALSHEEMQRVVWHHADVPPSFASALAPLQLTDFDRAAARTRVRPVEPFALLAPSPQPQRLRALVVDSDEEIIARILQTFPDAECLVSWMDPATARHLAGTNNYDVILCDAARVAASIPMKARRRLIVVAQERFPVRSLVRIYAPIRVLERPPLAGDLAKAVDDVLNRPIPPPELVLHASTQKPAARATRTLRRASPKEPLRLLLVDIDAGVRDATARMFGPDAAEVVVANGADAIARAFAQPFHLILCSTSTALASDGFLAAVNRDDPVGAKRVAVLVPGADAKLVGDLLPGHRIVRLPLDETLLRAMIGKVAPRTIERAAVADIPVEPPAPASHPRYRRLSVLVVDDHLDTQILFAAGAVASDADVALVTTTLAAFTHLTERAVDVLVISATMRSDGAEPFYRVIWRMMPALKAQTVLVTSLADAPPSPRIVHRPLSRAALADVVSRASR